MAEEARLKRLEEEKRLAEERKKREEEDALMAEADRERLEVEEAVRQAELQKEVRKNVLCCVDLIDWLLV